jgi:signal transduction histidine kinase
MSDRFRINESLADLGALTGAGLTREQFIDEVLELMLSMGFERARFWEVVRDKPVEPASVVMVARLPIDDDSKAAPGYAAPLSALDISSNSHGLYPVVTETRADKALTQVERDLGLGGRVRVEIPVTAGTETESVLACDWRGSRSSISPSDLRALRLVGSQIGSHLALEPLGTIHKTVAAGLEKPDRPPAELVYDAALHLGRSVDAAITAVFAFDWPHQKLVKRRQFVSERYAAAAKRRGSLEESYPAGGPALTGAAWRIPELRQIVSFERLAEDHFVDKESLEWHTAVLGSVHSVLYAVVGTLERRYLIRMMNRASRPQVPFLREALVLDAAIRDLRSNVDAAISLQRLRSLQNISGLTAENADPTRIVETIGRSLSAEGVDSFVALCHQRAAPQFSFGRSLGARCDGVKLDLNARWRDDSLYAAVVGKGMSVAVLSEHVGRSALADQLLARSFRAVLGQPMEAGQTEGVLFIGLDAVPPRTHDRRRELPVDLGYGTTALIHAYSRLLANAVEMHHSQERVIGAHRAYGLMGHEVRRPAAAVGSAGRSAIVASLEATGSIPDDGVRETLTTQLNDLHTDLRVAERRLGSALRLAKLVARESEGKLRLRFASADLSNVLRRAADDVELQAREDTSGWSPFFSFNTASRNLGKIVCDEDYVEEAVKNVLLNAVKYSLPRRAQTRSGKQMVRIVINAMPQDAWVGIQIRNWGWGIPAENRDVIFEPWVRGYAEEETEALAGMGLGLFLARRLIAAHRGEILCFSEATQDVFVPRPAVEESTPRGVPRRRPRAVTIHATTFEIRIPRDLTAGVHTHQWRRSPATLDGAKRGDD